MSVGFSGLCTLCPQLPSLSRFNVGPSYKMRILNWHIKTGEKVLMVCRVLFNSPCTPLKAN
eukprot:4732083-Amphidinium_carterae.2